MMWAQAGPWPQSFYVATALVSWRVPAATEAPPTWVAPPPPGRSSATQRPVTTPSWSHAPERRAFWGYGPTMTTQCWFVLIWNWAGMCYPSRSSFSVCHRCLDPEYGQLYWLVSIADASKMSGLGYFKIILWEWNIFSMFIKSSHV